MLDAWLFGTLALALGVKHAFDADHLVAVSNLLTRTDGVRRSALLATSWATGHMVTASLVATAIYFFVGNILPSLLARLELLIPALLLVVGAIGLGVELRRLHVHRHVHSSRGPEHAHVHVHVRPHHAHGAMAGIGVVHGLASNDELLVVLLVGLGASSWWQVVAGVGAFSVGVLAGMIAYAAGIRTLTARTGARWLPSAASLTFSALSIALAVYLLLGGSTFNPMDWVGSSI